MPANNTSTTTTTVNSTDSQSFATQVPNNVISTSAGYMSFKRLSTLIFNDIDTEKTKTGVSKDSSPCYGLCCAKGKCKNNN